MKKQLIPLLILALTAAGCATSESTREALARESVTSDRVAPRSHSPHRFQEGRPATPPPVQAQKGEAVVYDTELIRVTKKPTTSGITTVGSEASYRINVFAKQPVARVTVEEMLPSNLQYVSSDPAATTRDGNLHWDLNTLRKGESKSIDVRVSPQQRGTYEVCSVITAWPMLCLPITAGEAVLAITKTGPERAELGDNVNWDVTVTNTGDAPATNVLLVDTMPDSFRATTPTRVNIGTLEPGQSRVVQMTGRSSETGSFVNTAVASFDSGPDVSATAPVSIVQSSLAVEKTGPESAYALSNETYTITVRNTGDTTLRNVTVVDTLPSDMRVSGTGGGRTGRNDAGAETITWNIDSLASQASRSFNVVMTSPTPRTTVNRVAATSGGLTETDSQTTEWRAVPGIRTNIIDDVDPIRVGDQVIYTMSVLNQSPLESLEATVVVKFPAEVDAVSVGEGVGGTVVNSKLVEFQTFTLRPRQERILNINARGARTGNATVIMETQTNFRDDPVIDQESTTVY